MHRFIQKTAEVVLLAFLIVLLTGIWACLWLPPF
jgi:hypothetical protein